MIDRIKRLETLFLQEITTVISKMSSNGAIKGFITVTAVRVAKDLRTAKVFYSVFGGEEEKKQAADSLSVLRSELGAVLRGRLHLKRIPSFTFEPDDTPEKASKIESIFSVIEKEKNENRQ